MSIRWRVDQVFAFSTLSGQQGDDGVRFKMPFEVINEKQLRVFAIRMSHPPNPPCTVRWSMVSNWECSLSECPTHPNPPCTVRWFMVSNWKCLLSEWPTHPNPPCAVKFSRKAIESVGFRVSHPPEPTLHREVFYEKQLRVFVFSECPIHPNPPCTVLRQVSSTSREYPAASQLGCWTQWRMLT